MKTMRVVPKCPCCESPNHLWDDNMWEGCNNCGYLGSGHIHKHGSTCAHGTPNKSLPVHSQPSVVLVQQPEGSK